MAWTLVPFGRSRVMNVEVFENLRDNWEATLENAIREFPCCEFLGKCQRQVYDEMPTIYRPCRCGILTQPVGAAAHVRRHHIAIQPNDRLLIDVADGNANGKVLLRAGVGGRSLVYVQYKTINSDPDHNQRHLWVVAWLIDVDGDADRYGIDSPGGRFWVLVHDASNDRMETPGSAVHVHHKYTESHLQVYQHGPLHSKVLIRTYGPA